MDTRLGAERLRLMTNEPVPSRVDRGAKIGLHMRLVDISQRDLAEKVAISRVTVSKALAGDPSVQEKNLLRIETFLDELMEESGIDPTEPESPSSGPLTFQMTTADGMEIIVSGPVEDADVLREQVTKLIEEFKPRNP